MKKRAMSLLTALCMLAVLTGCSGRKGEEQAAVQTLPPARPMIFLASRRGSYVKSPRGADAITSVPTLQLSRM